MVAVAGEVREILASLGVRRLDDLIGRPEYLRQCVLMSLRRLGQERIDLLQFHASPSRKELEEHGGLLRERRTCFRQSQSGSGAGTTSRS